MAPGKTFVMNGSTNLRDMFSRKIRRPIERNEYQALLCSFAQGTLTNSSNVDAASATQRIAELLNAEDERGFVYYGERQWLEERQFRSVEYRYVDWIKECFLQLFHTQHWEDNGDAECYAHWKYYARDGALLWLPTVASGLVVGVYRFGMAVPGDDAGPTEGVLVRSFEVLHDLSYHLETVGSIVDTTPVDDDDEVHLNWVTLGVRPQEWRAVVSNEQGPFDYVDFNGWDPVDS